MALQASLSHRVSATPLGINLGIDFGTSFTKVCWRDVGREETGVVRFEHLKADKCLIPSIVSVSLDGHLIAPGIDKVSAAGVEVPYLKMRLAGAGRFETLPSVCGVELNGPLAAKALSAWFLASTIKHAQRAFLDQEALRASGRLVEWSANVGVPVEHFQGDQLAVFEEVLKVAWLWSQRGAIPSSLQVALPFYQRTLPLVLSTPLDCHAVPEIAAAVSSFTNSRAASRGMYLYFDVGGGTVDGVGFYFDRGKEETRLDCYSGKVDNLGVAALAHRASPGDPNALVQLLTKPTVKEPVEALQPILPEIHCHVGYVVKRCERKDRNPWIRRKGVPYGDRGPLVNLEVDELEPITVFVGGGAASSAWYRSAIQSTYSAHNHLNSGIPPYQFRQVPIPPDLVDGIESISSFGQFAIAYGLSIPDGEGPAITLPGAHDYVPPPKPYRPLGVTPYWDID